DVRPARESHDHVARSGRADVRRDVPLRRRRDLVPPSLRLRQRRLHGRRALQRRRDLACPRRRDRREHQQRARERTRARLAAARPADRRISLRPERRSGRNGTWLVPARPLHLDRRAGDRRGRHGERSSGDARRLGGRAAGRPRLRGDRPARELERGRPRPAGGGPSACSAAVDGVADWVALPDRLAADLQLLGAVGGFSLCLGTHVETLTHFPGTIDSSVENVSASFQASVTAPAQTPGGVASGGQMLFPEPSEYVLTVQGGTFQGGGTSLDTTSGDDGALSVQIDRGADPTTRAARVTVDGTVIVGDLGLVVQTHGGTNQVAVHETAGPQSATQVSFAFSPPVNSILDPGGTTNLCVKVTDAESKPIENLSVSWALGGPGSLAAPSSTTAAAGVACVDYHHPAAPVAQGDTATITAT